MSFCYTISVWRLVIPFHYIEQCKLVVVHIDTISLNNGEQRTRWELVNIDYPWESDYWIDGVGSHFGMLYHYGLCLTDFSHVLLCFYANNKLLYPESPPSCFIIGIEELTPDDPIRIYPNPSQLTLFIEVDNQDWKAFMLTNLMGKSVKRGMLHHGENQIDLSELPPGAYFILVENVQGHRYSQRLVKL